MAKEISPFLKSLGPLLAFDHDLQIDLVPLTRPNSELLRLAVRLLDPNVQQNLVVVTIDDVLSTTLNNIRAQAGELYPAALLMIASEFDRVSDQLKTMAGGLPAA